MAVEKYIDYIDDPNDTYEEYLEKAKKYNFRCVFSMGKIRIVIKKVWKY